MRTRSHPNRDSRAARRRATSRVSRSKGCAAAAGADAMSTRRIALVAVGIALASALFFTATYVLNRAMASAGGHWAWSAALRYLLTLPMLALVLPMRGGFA